MEQGTKRQKIRATMAGAFTLKFDPGVGVHDASGPDGLKTKIAHALAGGGGETGSARKLEAVLEYWHADGALYVFYEVDRLDVLDRLHPLGIVPKPLKHGEKVAATTSVITDMLGSVTQPLDRGLVEGVVGNVLANMIGEDDVAELRGDRLEAAANILDCDMGGTGVPDAAQKLRQDWAGLNAQMLDVQASLNAEGITSSIGDGVQELRQRLVDMEQQRDDAEALGRIVIQERDEARRQRDESAAISDMRDRLLRQRGVMLDRVEALKDAAARARNGNGVRATAEYIRWLLQRHPAVLAVDEATAHAERLDEVADAMDGIGSALAGGAQVDESTDPRVAQDEWKLVALQSIALAAYAYAQWSRMADLWRRAVTEGAAMRLALEAEERAQSWGAKEFLDAHEAAGGKPLKTLELGRLMDGARAEADRLRKSILSTSRPYMAAVPLVWVRHVLMHSYPGITGDMVNDVIRDLERATVDGKLPVVTHHPGAYWVRLCPDCNHPAHQPGQCHGARAVPALAVDALALEHGATEVAGCPCQTRVTL